MRKIVVTGFEPFGGAEINSSWEAVNALPDTIDDWQVCKLKLPVQFGVGYYAHKEITNIDPCAILCVGQAGGREGISLERVALNLRYATIPDNAGKLITDMPCMENGPMAILSRHNVYEQAAAIRAKGIPAAVSYTAGTFVCNELFYDLLFFYDHLPARTGFIHLPYLNGSGSPSMSLEDMTLALQTAIETLSYR